MVNTLPAQLSQALVAFVIEFDNEFEHRTPHRTSLLGGSGPWLTSMAMWWSCMRFVNESGISVRDLERAARMRTNLDGIRRWGYITIEPGGAGGRPKPKPGSLLRATAKGMLARQVWPELFGVMEERWRERFGRETIERLRESLAAVNERLDPALPDFLPILGYGLFSRVLEEAQAPGRENESLPLVSLMARVLLAFAVEFERESDVSLAIGANVLRLLDMKGVRLRDLPLRSGISKEAIAMAMGILQKKGLVETVADPSAARTKMVRLTVAGRQAQEAYWRRVAVIEERWRGQFGEAVDAPRGALKGLGEIRAPEPYPDGWRAAVPRPETLPHYPVVLHRGGYPDGS